MLSFNFLRVRAVTFITVASAMLRERGILWAMRGLIRYAGREVLWIFLLPAAAIGHTLGFRRLNVRIEHIGHLAAEPDTLVKEMRLGLISSKRWLLLAPSSTVSNQHLLDYWRHYFIVITKPWLCAFIRVMSHHVLMKQDVSRYVSKFFGTQDIYRINAQWGSRPPVLRLTSEDEAWGCAELEKLGVPSGRWFVAIHVREKGFLPRNEIIQSHRNASIANAIPAMQELVNRGGICVRMGDESMEPLPAIPGVIDYANHPMKSERMDVLLCAKARFFLGCTSGIAFVSAAFGVPVAQANMIPVETLGIGPRDLSMPKLLWSNRLERYLGFSEIFSTEVGGYFFSQQYTNGGIDPRENSPDEILALAVEMLDRLESKIVETGDVKQLHDRYIGLLRQGHYSYGAASRICLAFLSKHRSLFVDHGISHSLLQSE